jgi:predicted XRE-type DNA-binding protein
MKNRSIYAVLTGDIVGSSKWSRDQRKQYLDVLNTTLKEIDRSTDSSFPHLVYRGDSFQGLLRRPEQSLKEAILIRAALRSRSDTKKAGLDARIAIGIGTVEYLPKGRNIGEGDGEAFRNSGFELDRLKKEKMNLNVKTPWPDINEELKTECSLLDAIIRRWTKEQAEAMVYFLKGLNQEQIADQLHIAQPSINQRLQTAGYIGIQNFIDRFEKIILEKVGAG